MSETNRSSTLDMPCIGLRFQKAYQSSKVPTAAEVGGLRFDRCTVRIPARGGQSGDQPRTLTSGPWQLGEISLSPILPLGRLQGARCGKENVEQPSLTAGNHVPKGALSLPSSRRS